MAADDNYAEFVKSDGLVLALPSNSRVAYRDAADIQQTRLVRIVKWSILFVPTFVVLSIMSGVVLGIVNGLAAATR